jgi:hypothetical protein
MSENEQPDTEQQPEPEQDDGIVLDYEQLDTGIIELPEEQE